MNDDDQRWTALLSEADVMVGDGLRDVTIRAAHLPGAPEDVVMCDPDGADERIERIRRGGARRAVPAERVFMSRSLSSRAPVAAAMLTRAVMANWLHQRGRREPTCEHERRALTLAEEQLRAVGIGFDEDVTLARRQIDDRHVRAPVSNRSAGDVVAKAVAQIARQIGGRCVIVMGEAPMAKV